ncbi:MAG: Rrf2 family transcriptional regulator [Candidatus Wallbacteria bacterium]|nr:Rrf2 family transcriptional regulator [Candidatus Wallbacteria bacterium]
MAKFIQLSEATYLAIHSLALLVRSRQLLNVKKMAEMTGSSEFHLSKVMQLLEKGRLVKSVRGPKGGFTLSVEPQQITLLSVYEMIEGKLTPEDCPFGKSECPFGNCLLGAAMTRLAKNFQKFLKKTTLADLAE